MYDEGWSWEAAADAMAGALEFWRPMPHTRRMATATRDKPKSKTPKKAAASRKPPGKAKT